MAHWQVTVPQRDPTAPRPAGLAPRRGADGSAGAQGVGPRAQRQSSGALGNKCHGSCPELGDLFEVIAHKSKAGAPDHSLTSEKM